MGKGMTKENEAYAQRLSQFGRDLSIVFNRAFMYQANHPYIIESVDAVYQTLSQLLNEASPVVFILNREQFYVDEEPLDPRINLGRMVLHFKKAGIESLSFYKGLDRRELLLFLEILTSLNKYPDADAMRKALFKKGIHAIKVNHVFYQKVSADDEIISREVLNQVTPQIMDDAQAKTKSMFLNTLLESVLVEEFVKTLNLRNLMKSPGGLCKEMITADLNTAKQGENGEQGPGVLLMQQLEVIDQEVEKNLSEEPDVNLPELARALLDMREELIEGVEAQKALGIAYSNEEGIFDKANQIADKVIIRLIKEEYRAGKISVPRLAQILRRLIPEANELKRLFPKIKSVLMEEGMPAVEFMTLIQELGAELQNEELAKILRESCEDIGIDGQELIQEFKENPVQAAELVYLASEIRKGGGDEKALTDLLVNYVEEFGSKISKDINEKAVSENQEHFQRIMGEVKRNISQHLGRMELKDDVLSRLEDKLNQRVEDVLGKLRMEWIKSQPGSSQNESPKRLTVLETLEHSVSEDEEVGEILKIVRSKVETHEIDENDFGQIYSEISKQEQLRKSKRDKEGFSSGIMRSQGLMIFLSKEIAKAKRYGTPLSALGFSLVKAKAKNAQESGVIKNYDLIDAVLQRLAHVFRTADVVGELGRNKLVALLPMTSQADARLALRRAMKFLHLEPIQVQGIPVEIKVAGVVAEIDFKSLSDASAFVQTLSSQIMDMATRIRTIHAHS
jgi:hypothetical protein